MKHKSYSTQLLWQQFITLWLHKAQLRPDLTLTLTFTRLDWRESQYLNFECWPLLLSFIHNITINLKRFEWIGATSNQKPFKRFQLFMQTWVKIFDHLCLYSGLLTSSPIFYSQLPLKEIWMNWGNQKPLKMNTDIWSSLFISRFTGFQLRCSSWGWWPRWPECSQYSSQKLWEKNSRRQ